MGLKKGRKIQAIGINEIRNEDIALTVFNEDILEILEFKPWFTYRKAEEIIAKLSILYEEAVLDKEIRPLSYFISGEINNGKTALVTRFCNIMEHKKDYKKGDILYYTIPIRVTLKQVFTNILAQLFNKEIADSRLRSMHTQQIINMVIRELNKRRTKLLIIDEIQDLLVASSEDKKEIFKGFKQIMNMCRTRLVLVGTKDAEDLLYFDQNIDERMRVLELQTWRNNTEFGKMLKQIYQAYKPVIPDWDLVITNEYGKNKFNKPIVTILLKFSQGRLGRLLQIIQYAIIEALLNNKTNVIEINYRNIFNNDVRYKIRDKMIVEEIKKRKNVTKVKSKKNTV